MGNPDDFYQGADSRFLRYSAWWEEQGVTSTVPTALSVASRVDMPSATPNSTRVRMPMATGACTTLSSKATMTGRGHAKFGLFATTPRGPSADASAIPTPLGRVLSP